MSATQTTILEGIDHGRKRMEEKFEGDETLWELHAAADAADTILDVSRELRIGYHDARHDLDQIGRKEELAKGKSLAQKLRGQQ